MSVNAAKHIKTTSIRTRVPPLLNGDHLTVPEFERRYESAPENVRAELIEGIVIMAPPISDDHGESHSLLNLLLRLYASETPSVACGVCGSLRVDGKNEYQPDVALRIRSGPKARSYVNRDRLLEGAPELVAEISVSSAAYDLHEKKSVYERCGVQEYLVWQVMDKKLQWFALDRGAYAELKPRADGVIRSRVYPGLWLDVRSILAGDDKKAVATIEKGIKSAEHKAFVKTLKASK